MKVQDMTSTPPQKTFYVKVTGNGNTLYEGPYATYDEAEHRAELLEPSHTESPVILEYGLSQVASTPLRRRVWETQEELEEALGMKVRPPYTTQGYPVGRPTLVRDGSSWGYGQSVAHICDDCGYVEGNPILPDNFYVVATLHQPYEWKCAVCEKVIYENKQEDY